MKRQFRVYLQDIIESIERIEEYVGDLTEDDFLENTLIQDSVVRRLEIIGEAVKNIPEEIKKKHPDVNWKTIAGARDIFAHAYFNVNQTLVWRVVSEKLPALKEKVTEILGEIKE